jgi:hypothetical protein
MRRQVSVPVSDAALGIECQCGSGWKITPTKSTSRIVATRCPGCGIELGEKAVSNLIAAFLALAKAAQTDANHPSPRARMIVNLDE